MPRGFGGVPLFFLVLASCCRKADDLIDLKPYAV